MNFAIGQIVFAIGQIVFAIGQIVFAIGQIVFAIGQIVFAKHIALPILVSYGAQNATVNAGFDRY